MLDLKNKDLILGVDGGNTKTDYFLFDTEGHLLSFTRRGSCSQESLPDHAEGSYRIMKAVFDEWLGDLGLETSDIKAACLGLAGVDTPHQKEDIEGVLDRFNFQKYVVVNDCFIPIKAGSDSAIGACSINGTGTSTGAVDQNGKMIQVGGIGELTSDLGGGRYIARQSVKAAFDYAYRFGDYTPLYEDVLKAYNITRKEELAQAIVENYAVQNSHALTLKVFSHAQEGDSVSQNILTEVGKTLGLNTAGAIKECDFKDDVEVVIAGSVWIKGHNQGMIEAFKKTIESHTGKHVLLRPLEVPPATGAIIWATELATGHITNNELKRVIFKSVEDKLNEIEGVKL